MLAHLTLLSAFAVAITCADRLTVTTDSVFSWYNPNFPECPPDATCDTTPDEVQLAALISGHALVEGNLWLRDPDTQEWVTFWQVVRGLTPEPLVLSNERPSGPSPPPLTKLPYDEDGAPLLCLGSTEVAADACAWRTDWGVWACHPEHPVCACPFGMTAATVDTNTIRTVHWVWPAGTARASFVDLTPPQLSQLCRPPSGTIAAAGLTGVLATGTPVAQEVPCGPGAGGLCRAAARTMGRDAVRVNATWPRIYGPAWMQAAFSGGSAAVARQEFYLVADDPEFETGCSGRAYFSILEMQSARRRLAASCDRATAARFRVQEPLHAAVTPADLGAAIRVVDLNGVTLSPASLHTHVCWDVLGLRPCNQLMRRWRVSGYGGDRRPIVDLTTTTRSPPAPLKFVAV